MKLPIKFNISFAILLFFLLVLFRQQLFFSYQGISGNDWPYFYSEQLEEFPIVPYAWQTQIGLGGPQLSPWIDTYLFVIVNVFTEGFHIPWEIVQVVFFFIFAILLSVLSSTFLSKILFGYYSPFSALIYTANTYFLLILGGGQIGVALAYATAPLVFSCFIKTIYLLSGASKRLQPNIISWLIYSALSLSLQILFDPRITYVTCIGILLYFLFYYVSQNKKKITASIMDAVALITVPLCVSFLLHSFWILPLIRSGYTKSIGFSEAIRGASDITFYSFGSFSQALSLLHPNWPENIFGKTYFLQPEFLLLPIFVFSGLFFVIKDHKHRPGDELVQRNDLVQRQLSASGSKPLALRPLAEKAMLLPLYLIALLGIFLSKGTNEPFGNIYVWLYQYIPGFVFFRDPTKFYLLIAISYSILIPYFFTEIIKLISAQRKKIEALQIQKLTLFMFVLFSIFWVFTIRESVLGNLQKDSKNNNPPEEYMQLKDFLIHDSTFSRILWLPGTQHFSYYSAIHPAISGIDYFGQYEPKKVAERLLDKSVIEKLKYAGVKYVIVPYDIEGRLFQSDRKYDERKYQQTLSILKNISHLLLIKTFGKNVVFSLQDSQDKFFTTSGDSLTWQMLSPVAYRVSLSKAEPFVFSESFHGFWEAQVGNVTTPAANFNGINYFSLLEPEGLVEIRFSGQRFVYLGLIVSGLTAAGLVFSLLYLKKR